MNILKKHWILVVVLLILSPSQSFALDIDFLMVYTKDARIAMGGETAMKNEINSMIHEVNIVLSNSRITHRLRLLGSQEVIYTESGKAQTDLTRLSMQDGFMDEVLTERDRVGADLVCLITSNSDSNGVAWPYGSTGPYNGYCTIKLTSDYWFLGQTRGHLLAHETGHMFGCDHNSDGVGQPGQGTGQGYQYWVDIVAYGTVMAYPSNSIMLHKFVWYYSNPDILQYSIWGYGVPMGVEGEHDCAGKITENASTVAGYRDTIIPDNIVWVDTSKIGAGNGTKAQPYNTVHLGINNVPVGGKLIFTQELESWEDSQIWAGTISKPMTIISKGGAMVIGK